MKKELDARSKVNPPAKKKGKKEKKEEWEQNIVIRPVHPKHVSG